MLTRWSSCLQSPTSKVAARPWQTIFRTSGAASKHLPVPALLIPVTKTATNEPAVPIGDILPEIVLLASAYASPRVDLDEVADRDWMQLAWTMRYECPDLFTETLLVMRAQARAHALGLEPDDDVADDDKRVETSDTDRGHATPAAREDDEESAI